MHSKIIALIAASCAFLASCSGGGASSGTVTIGSGQTSTPTPTPTPTQTLLNTGEVKPSLAAAFIAATMDLTITGGASQTDGVITGGSTSDRVTTFDTPQFKASYNAGYSLADAVNATFFGAGQLSYDTTSPNGHGIVLFKSLSGTTEDYLALYQITTYSSSSGGAGYTVAKYGGVGGWQHTALANGVRRTRLDYFGFGDVTPPASLPTTGRVRYTVMATGNYANDSDLYFLPPSANTIYVDFAAKTYSGFIGFAGDNFFKNVSGGIGSFNLSGSVSGNLLTGTITNGSLTRSGGIPGQYRLMFVGPNANEIVLTYILNNGQEAVVGAALGVIDPYIQ